MDYELGVGREKWLDCWPADLSTDSKVISTGWFKDLRGAGVYIQKTDHCGTFHLGVHHRQNFLQHLKEHKEVVPVGTQGEDVMICLDNMFW